MEGWEGRKERGRKVGTEGQTERRREGEKGGKDEWTEGRINIMSFLKGKNGYRL